MLIIAIALLKINYIFFGLKNGILMKKSSGKFWDFNIPLLMLILC